ncbi:FHA domain-containing protein [Thermogutta sp.]|uniref:FHA domain-containing protein n=1 Tax=Thermogutta sp. TaxID=1962930 RepID=UPI0032201B2D
MNSARSHTSFWCEGELRLVAEGYGQTRTVVVRQPFARLGTLQGCELSLGGPGMPKRLLYFHVTKDGVFAVPLVPRDRFAPLPFGWFPLSGRFVVGPYRVSWEWLGQSANQRPPSSHDFHPDLTAKGTAALERVVNILVDDRPYGQLRLTRALTLVGRRPPCHVVFTSRTVSSCHCVIICEHEEVWVVDLCSGNACILDRRAIDVARWSPGSTLTLGRVSLVLKESPEKPHGHMVDGQQQVESDSGQKTPVAIPHKITTMREFAADESVPVAEPDTPPPETEGGGQLKCESLQDGPRPRKDTDVWQQTAVWEVVAAGPAAGHDGACTEILIEETMQGDRSSTWAKDLVLSLLASGNLEGIRPGETDRPSPSCGSAGPLLSAPPEWTSGADHLSAPDPNTLPEPWNSKIQELAYKEALLQEWARSLDEMSESLLRLQEELVAEEDRFAQEKEDVQQAQSQLARAWQEYEIAAARLREWESSLVHREKQLDQENENLADKQQQLLQQENALAEERQNLANLREKHRALLQQLEHRQSILDERERVIDQQLALLAEEERRLQEARVELEANRAKLEAAHQEYQQLSSALQDRETRLVKQEKLLAQRLAELDALQERLVTWELQLREQEARLTARGQELLLREQELITLAPQTEPAKVTEEAPPPSPVAKFPQVRPSGDAPTGASAESATPVTGYRPWRVVNLPLRRRWKVLPWEVLTGAAAALIVMAAVGWFYPRTYSTLHRLSLFDKPALLSVRDGQLPGEFPPEVIHNRAPLWPDSPAIVEKLRHDAILASCPLVQQKGIDWVFETVKIGRTEGLPYVTWQLIGPDARSAKIILERWQKVYFDELCSVGKSLVARCRSMTEQELNQLSARQKNLQQRLETISRQFGAADVRTLEKRSRELLQSASLAEQEWAQLAAEIEAHQKKLREAQSILNNPVIAISEEELSTAVAKRLAERPDSASGVEPAAIPKANGPSSENTPSPPTASSTPPSDSAATSGNTAELGQSKLEVIKSIVRQELAAVKKQEAFVLVESLAGELRRLQERRDELHQQSMDQRKQASDLSQAAAEVQSIHEELDSVTQAIAKWETASRAANKLLAEVSSPPELETLQAAVRVHVPILMALVAASAAFLPFAVWRILRLRLARQELAIPWVSDDNTMGNGLTGNSPSPAADRLPT